MKKLYKILLIIAVVAVVATSTILGVYFGVLNRIDDTNVTIDSIEVTTLTDNSLVGVVNFTIVEPSTVEATFKILSFNVSYQGTLLGTGVVTTIEFSTQQASHSTDFSLDITDEDYFALSFVDDFIDAENITITIDAKIQFTGALSKLPQKTITQLVEIGGFNGLPVAIDSFELLDVTDDELQLEVSASINNPTQIALTIDTLEADIYYDDTLFGNISKSTFALDAGVNIIEVETWIGGDKDLLTDFLGEFLGSSDLTIDLDLNVTLANFSGESLVISKLVEDIEVASVGDDLVSIEIDMISLSVSGSLTVTVSYEIDTTVTINNPVDIEINITSFDGLLVYDDSDGASFALLNYAAQDNITLTPVSFDWSSAPLELPSLGSDDDTFTYSDSVVEQGVRLLDEYTVKNQLHISIINGEVTVQIGTFEITVPIEIYNIPVPNN